MRRFYISSSSIPNSLFPVTLLAIASIFTMSCVGFVKGVALRAMCFLRVFCSRAHTILQTVFSFCNLSKMFRITTGFISAYMIYNILRLVRTKQNKHKKVCACMLSFVAYLPVAIFISGLSPLPTAVIFRKGANEFSVVIDRISMFHGCDISNKMLFDNTFLFNMKTGRYKLKG